MGKYCFGVDVGGTTVKLGLFNTNGDLMEKWEIPTVTEDDGKAILPDCAKSILKKMDERGLFYPAEAIAQGLEGETLVLLILDESGKVSAARIEQGSGYRILDDAALQAVRSLHSLPANTPRETLLPVRFRLK